MLSSIFCFVFHRGGKDASAGERREDVGQALPTCLSGGEYKWISSIIQCLQVRCYFYSFARSLCQTCLFLAGDSKSAVAEFHASRCVTYEHRTDGPSVGLLLDTLSFSTSLPFISFWTQDGWFYSVTATFYQDKPFTFLKDCLQPESRKRAWSLCF